MNQHPLPQDSTAAKIASLAAGRYRPGWDVPSVVVLERASDVAAVLAMELAARELRPASSSAEPAERRLQCQSADSVADVMHLLARNQVIAVVVDLNSRVREALVLLQRLQSVAVAPPTVAIGTPDQQELTGVLLEAGCSALITVLPYDRSLADWISRVRESRNQASDDRVAHRSGRTRQDRPKNRGTNS